MPLVSTLRAFAVERITVDNTSGGVRLTISNVLATPYPKNALVLVETAPLRWYSDGTAPTSTVGNIAYPGDVIHLEHPSELWNFRAIRTTATSAAIQATYYR